MTSAFRFLGRFLLALLMVATILVLAGFELPFASQQATAMHEAPGIHRPSLDRCIDDDADRVSSSNKPCHCPDPTRASNAFRTGDGRVAWLRRHEVYRHDIAYEAALQKKAQKRRNKQAVNDTSQLDVVFLGDSILERWNGTRNMGQDDGYPEYRASFASFFNRRQHGDPVRLQGLSLGTSGDITTELLWHLQNGVITTNDGKSTALQPKVWFVLIGTNALGRMDCSKRTTLAGILHVLQFIQTHRPKNELLLVHGLLPRADTYNQQNYSLGHYWQDILWINQELQRFCDLHSHWYYMEANDLFLTNATGGDLMIDARTMSDSLHPDLEGYNLWGERIVNKVLQMIAPPPAPEDGAE
jgi:lysophospholipase L1-like esterase